MKIFWWIRGLVLRLFGIEIDDEFRCPWCGYDHHGEVEQLSLTDVKVGVNECGYEYPVHWFEGTATCPRCGHEFEYGDSN